MRATIIDIKAYELHGTQYFQLILKDDKTQRLIDTRFIISIPCPDQHVGMNGYRLDPLRSFDPDLFDNLAASKILRLDRSTEQQKSEQR